LERTTQRLRIKRREALVEDDHTHFLWQSSCEDWEGCARRPTVASGFANHLHQSCWHAREQIGQAQFGADFFRFMEIAF
jgi:hypothetical protein